MLNDITLLDRTLGMRFVDGCMDGCMMHEAHDVL